jgi:two-component sensor histidine kinase
MAMSPQKTHHAMQFYYLDYSTIFFFILCSAFIVWKIIKNDEENLLIVTASGEKILKYLKEKEGLLKEIHHRVKNNLAVISSLLRLQSNQVEDDKYQNMLKESENRIRSMALVHEQLYRGRDFNKVYVKAYVDSLARNVCRSCSTGKEVSISIQADEIFMAIDNLVPLGLIMNEILTNAIQHAFQGREKPEISVTMQKAEAGKVILTISDNGIGLPDGFDINQCKGLGLQLIHLLTSQIKGELKVTSENGTMFELIFPEKLAFARHLTRDG